MSTQGASSAEVQRDAEAERAELVSTLDQLRENLRPENVVDEVMASAKITTSDISDRVWQTARAHPIPAVLIAVGVAMILGVGQKVRSSAAAKEHDWTDDGRFPRQGASISARDFGGTRRPTSRITDGTKALRPQVVRAASETTSFAREGFSSFPENSAMSKHNRSRDNLSGSLSRLLEDQPLVLAALGVAVGAAVGAAIPSTETEGRLMGDASVSFKSRAQDLAQSELSHIKETASSTLDNLKQAAADHGVSTDNLSGLVQDAGSTVRDAANDVASHAADSAGLKG